MDIFETIYSVQEMTHYVRTVVQLYITVREFEIRLRLIFKYRTVYLHTIRN